MKDDYTTNSHYLTYVHGEFWDPGVGLNSKTEITWRALQYARARAHSSKLTSLPGRGWGRNPSSVDVSVVPILRRWRVQFSTLWWVKAGQIMNRIEETEIKTGAFSSLTGDREKKTISGERFWCFVRNSSDYVRRKTSLQSGFELTRFC